MFLKDVVNEVTIMQDECLVEGSFHFNVIILDENDSAIGNFTDEEYKDNIVEIYKDWEVVDRCIEFNNDRDCWVMTIRIREEAE